MSETVIFEDLGLVDYKSVWEYQSGLQKTLIDNKLVNRDLDEKDRNILPHRLLFCEHPPVYTLGKSGKESHLLISEMELADESFSYYKINRGGDITYHGPGQIVVYPIFDLDRFFTDVHKYVRLLEQIVIDVVEDYGVNGERIDGLTGVWLKKSKNKNRKLCAIGVHLSRWVTMHGLALNVNTNLSHFKNIIPCGIGDEDKTVSSIANEVGYKVSLEEVKLKLKSNFARHFGFSYLEPKEDDKERISFSL